MEFIGVAKQLILCLRSYHRCPSLIPVGVGLTVRPLYGFIVPVKEPVLVKGSFNVDSWTHGYPLEVLTDEAILSIKSVSYGIWMALG